MVSVHWSARQGQSSPGCPMQPPCSRGGAAAGKQKEKAGKREKCQQHCAHESPAVVSAGDAAKFPVLLPLQFQHCLDCHPLHHTGFQPQWFCTLPLCCSVAFTRGCMCAKGRLLILMIHQKMHPPCSLPVAIPAPQSCESRRAVRFYSCHCHTSSQ